MKKIKRCVVSWLLVFALCMGVSPWPSVKAVEDLAVVEDSGNTGDTSGENENTNDSSQNVTEMDENSDQNVSESEEEIEEITNTDTNAENEQFEENSASMNGVNDENIAEGEMGKINYCYIDLPYLSTPNTQNIVISFGTVENNLEQVRLRCREENGNIIEIPLSQNVDELYLFSKDFSEAETGIYTVESFVYIVDGQENSVDLKTIGLEANFGVNVNKDEPVDNSAEMSGIEDSVVSVDKDSTYSIESRIPEAIEETSEDVSTTASVNARSAPGDTIVVLDPGHGGSDPGASGNGLIEKELTLKIASYCKRELEKYYGVKVYMTRSSDVGVGLEERVQIAKNYGADVFVSIHINSASPGAYGAEVFYPNANYNPSVHEPGKNLAQNIQNELVALGLGNRGIKEASTVNDTYPDGSKQDYYSVIRNSKLNGFPGIIVEHAFISNPSDAAFLAQESNLQRLGIADATGIAKQYNLLKKDELGIAQTYIENYNPVEGTFDIVAAGVNAPLGVSGVSMAVSCSGNPAQWYSATKEREGVYRATVNIERHAYEEGIYTIQAYVRDLKNQLASGYVVTQEMKLFREWIRLR